MATLTGIGALAEAKAASISVITAGKLDDYVRFKAAPTVISQNPAAGTPVIQGMTIEIKATSLSDVPWKIVDASAAAQVNNVSVADIKQLVEGDPVLSDAVKNGGTLNSDQAAIVAQKFNAGLASAGLSGEMTGTDAVNLVKSLGNSGLIGV